MNHDLQEHERSPGFWTSRYAIGLTVIGAVAGYFLLTEYRAHFIGPLPLPLQWSTLLTLLIFLILLVVFWRLALTEEIEMGAQFGETFERYTQRTPRFIPRLARRQTA